MSGSSRNASPRSRKAGASGGGRNWRAILQKLLILGIASVVVMCAIFFFAYRATTIPDPNSAYQAQASYVYYSNGKSQLGSFASQNRDSIPLAEIPQSMQDAVIAAEDRTFYTNKGIDPKGILRAAFSNAKGNATQGASTITQQYVKILYLSQERTFKRKIKEAFLSLKVQQQQSKQQILEGYLNTIYFGRGAYGIQAAAKAYFGVDAKQLKVNQSAMLASVINSPNYLSSDSGQGALLDRYDYVLNGMTESGSLDGAQASRYSAKLPVTVKTGTSNAYGGQKGFMLTMVKKQLLDLGFTQEQIDSGGLRVTTTLSRKGMAAARDGVLAAKPADRPALHMGSATVDTQTGGLVGFYAGQDYLKSQLNWAEIGRPPGSTFKPFALAMALDQGWSLKDTFDGNSPYTFPDGRTVVNEGEGGGVDEGAHISLLTALVKSVNTAFIDLTMSTPGGADKIKKMAVKMGIPADSPGLDANSGISLGTADISPIEMANAYSTIADGGQEHKWFLIKKVTSGMDGKVLYKHKSQTKEAISSDVAADVSYAMQQVVTSGTGMKARALGRPAAGKTGTATDDKKDVVTSWFVGFTPQYSTAVLMTRGNGRGKLNDTSFISSYFGATYPTLAWTAVMSRLMDGVPVESFPPPANLDGTAPATGHAPYVPPPPPKPKPKPTKKAQPKPTKSAAPKPTPTPTPTQTPPPAPAPSPSPSPSCGVLGNCRHGH